MVKQSKKFLYRLPIKMVLKFKKYLPLSKANMILALVIKLLTVAQPRGKA